MRVDDFDFKLPPDLIAQYPLKERSLCKLLIIEKSTKTRYHRHFFDLPDFITNKDLLVFNDSYVIAARIFAKKDSGAKVEILIERLINDNECLAQLRSNRTIKIGSQIILTENESIKFLVINRKDRFFYLKTDTSITYICEKYGHVPLPPYINRADNKEDVENYQNIYANHNKKGSVAASTAGLHFDDSVLNKLKSIGVKIAYVTLHVGAGTFLPVKTDNITNHKMHSEVFSLPEKTVNLINQTKLEGGRVIAVGTTSTRVLETVAEYFNYPESEISDYEGETDIFIYPGKPFRIIDGMITNFHLPKSTLLMLVCALAGVDFTIESYIEAVEKKYKFFSYGDAMFII